MFRHLYCHLILEPFYTLYPLSELHNIIGTYSLGYIYVPYATTMTFSGINYNFKIVHINSFLNQKYGTIT